MRVLVTGSAGFVGSHLVREYPDAVGCDLKQGWDCRDLFASDRSHFDLVFHCAATVGGREGIDFNSAFLGANNLQLDGAMFEWALKTRPGRIVYFSSAAAYSTALQSKPTRCREELIVPGQLGAPDESYGWVKLTGEVVASKVRNAGVPVTVVRPFSSYDYDQDDDYPFPEFIHRAQRRDDPFVVWGDGGQVRDFIHIDDLVQAIQALVENEVDGPVNLGTGVPTSMDALAELCMASAGYQARIKHLADKPVGVRYRVADIAKLLEFYTPQISLSEGVERALQATNVAA